jgi:hypothetical protein
VKSADVEIPDKTIEKPRILRQQSVESIPQAIAGLIRNEGKISGHLPETRLLLGETLAETFSDGKGKPRGLC